MKGSCNQVYTYSLKRNHSQQSSGETLSFLEMANADTLRGTNKGGGK